jgi:dTDP-4-amino-4,6-dideoxygalactose transaminase
VRDPERVPLQDLEAHHEPLQAELAMAAVRVLASGQFICSAEVAALESELAAALGVPHAVGVSSGTDGLLAVLMACGVVPGAEVVTTPFSFFASMGSILRLGARPVFADIDADTLNLDPRAAAERVTARTRAVLVVHLFGRAARLGPLEDLSRRQDLSIVEDAAQAVAASLVEDGAAGRARSVGSLGRAAVLSFFPSKNLGGFGDGGMVLTHDAALAGRLRLLRGHGAAVKHHHDTVGGNFRLDELQAALLRVKLPHLPRWTARRREVASQYRERLADLPLRLPPPDPGCVWNQFVVRVPDGKRDGLRAHLAGAGVDSAVYYPIPLHLQPCVSELGWRRGDFPEAERAAQETLALPIFPELTTSEVDRVAQAARGFYTGDRRARGG